MIEAVVLVLPPGVALSVYQNSGERTRYLDNTRPSGMMPELPERCHTPPHPDEATGQLQRDLSTSIRTFAAKPVRGLRP